MNEIPFEKRKVLYIKEMNTNGNQPLMREAVKEAARLIEEMGEGDTLYLAYRIAKMSIAVEKLRVGFELNDDVCTVMDTEIRLLAKKFDIPIDKI